MARFCDKAGSGGSDEVATLEVVADRVIRDMRHAAALHANLDRMGRDNSLAAAFNNTPHVNALNTIYRALLEQLVLVLVRMYDPAEKQKTQADRASLKMVQRLLKDDAIQAYLIEEAARQWPHPLGPGKVKEVAQKHLSDIIVGVDNVLRAPPFGTWMQSLREYRNNFVAHSLTAEIVRPPVYASMEEVLRETLRIGGSLRLVVRHQAQDWKQALLAREKEAACFWDAVLRGMSIPSSDPWDLNPKGT